MAAPDKLAWILSEFSGAGISGACVSPAGIEEAPSEPGAYVLCLRLAARMSINIPSPPAGRLDTGWYLYAGSAHGNGGIRARLKRHFKSTKKLHWHIDRLTVNADQIAALASIDRSECQLVDELLKSNRFSIALAGFGSTDCRICESHLLRSRAM